MKKILAILCTLAILLSLCAIPAAASGSGSLSLNSASGKPGDTVTLFVSLSNNPGLVSMRFTVEYSSDLELVSVSNAGLLSGWTKPSSTIASPYTIRWADSLEEENNYANGKILTLTFKIKETATPGKATVKVNFKESNDFELNKNSFNSPSATITIHCKAHTYSEWTSKDNSYHTRACTACGTEETATHGWDTGKVTTPATCSAKGVKTFTCATCGGTKTEEIPMTAHTYAAWTKADDSNHTRACTVCGLTETVAHAWDNGTVTMAPTCQEGGVKTYTCTTCKATKTEAMAKSEDHNYGAWVKVDDNTHSHTCPVCGKAETATHAWDNGTVTKAPTCQEGGVKTYSCTACGATKTEALAKSDSHTYGAWTKASDDTHSHTCTVCGQVETEAHSYSANWSKDNTQHWHECSVCKDQKDAAAHTPGAAATETEPQTCTTCGYVIQPALGHKHSFAGNWTADAHGHWYTCSGCEEKGSYAEHVFDNACDPDCATCGYIREASHAFGTDWESNGQNHWLVCAKCGMRQDESAHIPGAAATETKPQTCTICGYELAPALKAEETKPAEATPEATEPAAEPVKSGKADKFPWWIIVVAVPLLTGVAVAVAKKKKK